MKQTLAAKGTTEKLIMFVLTRRKGREREEEELSEEKYRRRRRKARSKKKGKEQPTPKHLGENCDGERRKRKHRRNEGDNAVDA